MSQIALPSLPARRVRIRLAWIAPVLIVALLTTWVLMRRAAVANADAGNLVWSHVVPADFDVKITKDGELQAQNNIEVVCEVEGSTTIQTLVKEGTTVK
jgi:hypothetical protein